MYEFVGYITNKGTGFMDWTKAVIGTISGATEAIAALLSDYGIEGVQIEDAFETAEFLKNKKTHWDYADDNLLISERGNANVVFYVAAGAHGTETLIAVKNALDALKQSDRGEFGELSLAVETVNDEDWLHEWKKYYKPFKIGENIIVKPVWEEYVSKPGELVYNINPGSVFGTGLHQSTQLCVAQLEKCVRKNDCILDVGCGSGILAVIALLLGAEKAVATDIEPAAAFQAEGNARLNGFSNDRFSIYIGNILTDKALLNTISKCYDIVTANIIADAIIALSPLVSALVRPGGTFISSGIIHDKAEMTKTAIAANGFEITGEFTKDEWVCLTARKL